MVDIAKNSQAVWHNVASKVNKALVFMDTTCAECLHWNGGALLLFNAGALNIKEFSSFENGKSEDKKGVFITSGPLHGTNMNILSDILKSSSFQYVIVICSLSVGMHTIVNYGRGEDERKAFVESEEQLLEWMGNMNFTAEIIYLPIVSAPITPNMFVLPEHSQTFPLLPTDLDTLVAKVMQEHKGGGTASAIDYGHLPKGLQLTLKLLVCSLNSFLESLSISEDVHGLGHTSRIVASELASLPWAKHRRKNAQNKASLLLVDRSLDITNVVSHNWDTLLDRIMSLLPKLEGHNNDVCVNMAPICSVSSNPNHSVIVPGCLAHPEDNSACALLQVLASRKHKEAVMEVNRQLVETASRNNLPIKLTGRPSRVTAEQLESHLTHFKGQTRVIRKHRGILQLVIAVVETMKHSASSRLDSLLGIEKGLLQSIGEDDVTSCLTQVIQTLERNMKSSKCDRLYKLEDVFLLLIFMYSMIEEKDDVTFITEERQLQDILVRVIIDEKDNLPDFLLSLVGENPHKETAVLIVQDLFEKLKCLSRCREDLQHFDSVYDAGSATSQTSLTPLLKTVIEAVFNPSKPELPDIEYKSTGFRDLLKSGFGLFMNVSKPRPSDHPLLIVFIIGGTTSTEARQIKEAVAASKSNVQVVVGSTKLLSPTDLLNQIFVNNHLHPKVES